MELLIVIIIIVCAINAGKKKNAKQTAARRKTPRTASPAAVLEKPAAAAKTVPAQPIPVAPKAAAKPAPTVRPGLKVSRHIEEGCGTTGSIQAAGHIPHEHEGKPLPCHPGDSDRIPLSPEPAVAPAAKASPLFTGDDLVRSVVMSEILTRPRFENGRRVIR